MFFAIIQRQALRGGDFASVQELMAAIRRFCDGWNQRCQPFAWAKDADQILTKLNRQNTSQTPTSSVAAGRHRPRTALPSRGPLH